MQLLLEGVEECFKKLPGQNLPYKSHSVISEVEYSPAAQCLSVPLIPVPDHITARALGTLLKILVTDSSMGFCRWTCFHMSAA